MKAKFCEKCGSELVNGRCPKCAAESAGNPAGGSQAAVQQPNTQQPYTQPNTQQQYIRAKGGWRNFLRVMLWIFLVVGIGFFVMVCMAFAVEDNSSLGFWIMIVGTIIILLLAASIGLNIELADNVARILEKLNK